MTTSRRTNFSWWRFVVPFLLQLAIILIVPAKSAYTYNFGTPAVLQTIPVDPYSLLRGYSQTLSYDISSVNSLKKFPGGDSLKKSDIFYVILELNTAKQKPPTPSKIIKVVKEFPQDLTESQVALKGNVARYNRVNYGLETYYMPESQRNKINQEIRDLGRNSEGKRPFVVEIRVDRWGNSVPVSLWLEDKQYTF
ncbi:MAG: GDYXXLXY domain-containing protein [Cyanobacteria bacterium J06600_6]